MGCRRSFWTHSSLRSCNACHCIVCKLKHGLTCTGPGSSQECKLRRHVQQVQPRSTELPGPSGQGNRRNSPSPSPAGTRATAAPAAAATTASAAGRRGIVFCCHRHTAGYRAAAHVHGSTCPVANLCCTSLCTRSHHVVGTISRSCNVRSCSYSTAVSSRGASLITSVLLTVHSLVC